MNWNSIEDDDDRTELPEIETRPPAYRVDLREEICPDCNGTGLDYLSLSYGHDAGGSCPSCINGRRFC